MQYVAALLMALVLNAAANLFMKIGMKTVQESGGILRGGVLVAAKTVLTSPVLLIGLFCFAVNAGFYMYALQSKALKISVAYPIMVGGGFVLIAVVARIHPQLAERLSWGQLVGIGLVLLGIVLIAAQSDVAGT